MVHREEYLLIDPEYSSEEAKTALLAIITHELSHQWFGHYVTPTWWDYTWMSEGFATYVQYELMAKVSFKMKRILSSCLHPYG